MVVVKRQRKEEPTRIEQRKVWGPEWGPQVEWTALLASPIYIGQAQGEEKKHIKRGAKGPRVSLSHVCALSVSLSPLCVFWVSMPPTPWGCIFLYFLNKTEGAITLSQSCEAPRALMYIASNFCWDETEPRRLHQSQRVGVPLSSLRGSGSACPHALKMYFPAIF